MKFSSIKEYFYKMYNVCYLITLIPLGLFIYLYLNLQVGKINAAIQEPEQVLIAQIGFFVFGVFTLTIVHLLVKRKMRIVSREVGLGNKMDRYYNLALSRQLVGATLSLIMGFGLLLTSSEIFSIFFLGILLWMAYHWPSAKRVCVELLLKGDEREMILYKKESL